MAYQSATHTFDCPRCGGLATYEVAGYLDGKRLRWNSAVHCDACSNTELHCEAVLVCLDDYAMLRDQCGWFGLHIAVTEGDRVRLLKELRVALNLSMSEAARILSIRTGPQLCGLEIEMRHVESLVHAALPRAVTTVARIAGSSERGQPVAVRPWMSR